MLDLALHVVRDGFDLRIDCRLSSQWTVLFGHSGAGKSTLLRLIAGLDRDARGETIRGSIELDAQPLTDTALGIWLAPGRRRTSLVSQQPALFPHMSVEANVAYGLKKLDHAARAQRIAEVLELAGATEFAGRNPGSLSGGQAQRVALARALAPMPRLLLLDEPFSALDGAASDALIDRLQPWLEKHNIQTVLATHDAADAFSTGAEVLLLTEGRLSALGPASEVLARERQRIARRLQGS